MSLNHRGRGRDRLRRQRDRPGRNGPAALRAAWPSCLGGKLACTRPLLDRGVLPFKLVDRASPALSVEAEAAAVGSGVSGAVNHVTGFSDADVVVAVNTDPEAAIFNYCTYGIVGDMDEVCEAMLAKLGE